MTAVVMYSPLEDVTISKPGMVVSGWNWGLLDRNGNIHILYWINFN